MTANALKEKHQKLSYKMIDKNCMENIKVPSNLFEAMEIIIENAEGSKMGEEFFKNNRVLISYISEKLGLSPKQVVFLSLFIDNNDEQNISIPKIAKYLGCRPMHILSMSEELEGLEKLRYIRFIDNRKSSYYRVPKEVIKALKHNDPYIHQPLHPEDLPAFFDDFKKLIKEKDNSELDYRTLRSQTKDLMQCIPDSSLTRGLKRYKLNDDLALLFIYMAYLFVEDSNEEICLYEIENIYDDGEIPYWCKSELRHRSSELFENNLIENTFEDGMGRSDAFKLTEKAKYELLADLDLKEAGKSDKGLIKHDSLQSKKLIYNPQIDNKIKNLGNILSPKKFSDVQQRLKNEGLRTGFCCLFYGAPGTGKTETVYQIARATKRNIMQVDVEKIKSCWVGESEKNIKSLFDRYHTMCKNSSTLPILLFNEADAVLGVRMDGASKAVDKMENSLQNIILQEMEKLEGIMIATTNLIDNLDKAFERRFLYKIRFDRPDEDVRSKIWERMLPQINKKDALALGKEFDLSGGEIENIVRKHTVNSILSASSDIDLDNISSLCREERIKTHKSTRIGF